MANPCNGRCCFIILSVLVILFLFCCRWTTCSIIPLQCNQTNYTEGTAVAKNIKTVLDNLVKASRQPAAFNTSVVGQGNDSTVYGLLQCRGDQTADLCFNSSQGAKQVLETNCSRSLGATIWYSNCFMRYEIYDYVGSRQEGSNFMSFYNIGNASDLESVLERFESLQNIANASDPERFDDTKQKLLRNLIAKAGSDPRTRYASGSAEDGIVTIYGLVQCWRYLSTYDCNLCLKDQLSYLLTFAKHKIGGRSIGENCVGEFEVSSFFGAPAIDDSTAPAPAAYHNKTSTNTAAIVGGGVGGFVVLLIFSGVFLLLQRRRRKARSKEQPRQIWISSPPEEEDDLPDQDGRILFSAEALKIATNNFHDDQKLGQGGFGTVYKGILLNGENIAVKKHSFISSQAKLEFMNEIKLLMNVQHRNLVKLLGCCVEGSQRILVYEYLSNSSLDKFLFDSEKKKHLDWKQRVNVIEGVAKGLLYLHEDSKIKIIHRDIKAANILLDDKFEPKIADFGLAKLFSDTESRILTRVAGTCGYMAPEYAMQGQLSIKADVYSFGVLVMEIICGRRNNDFDSFNGKSMLVEMWTLYQEGNIFDIVDESIRLNCVQEQVMRCMHVGLLCIQANADLRPPMSKVLSMLSNASLSLANPTMPAFVNFNSDSHFNIDNGSHTATTRTRYDPESTLTLPR